MQTISTVCWLYLKIPNFPPRPLCVQWSIDALFIFKTFCIRRFEITLDFTDNCCYLSSGVQFLFKKQILSNESVTNTNETKEGGGVDINQSSLCKESLYFKCILKLYNCFQLTLNKLINKNKVKNLNVTKLKNENIKISTIASLFKCFYNHTR